MSTVVRAQRYLSGRFFTVLSVWLLIGVLGMQWPILFFLYGALALVLFAIVFSDRRSLPRRDLIHGSIRVPTSIELDKSEIVEISCTGLGDSGLSSRSDHVVLPTLRRMESGSRSSQLRGVNGGAGTGKTSLARCSVTGKQLGAETLEGFYLESVSALGLWFGRIWVESSGITVHVIPSREVIPEQKFSELISRQRLLLSGSRVRSRAATPDQYYTSRRYQYPDSIRSIDWKKSAKTGALHTKVFDSLFETRVVLAFDMGRGMIGSVRGSVKQNYYFAAAHMIVERALRAGDTVSALFFADKPLLVVPRITSAMQFDAITADPRCVPQEVATDYSLLQTELPRLSPQRAVVIVLSDLTFPSAHDGIQQAISTLATKHMVIALSLIDRRYHLVSRLGQYGGEALSDDEHLEYLYLYWLKDAFDTFARGVDLSGAAAINIPERYWVDACSRIFERVRFSGRV